MIDDDLGDVLADPRRAGWADQVLDRQVARRFDGKSAREAAAPYKRIFCAAFTPAPIDRSSTAPPISQPSRGAEDGYSETTCADRGGPR